MGIGDGSRSSYGGSAKRNPPECQGVSRGGLRFADPPYERNVTNAPDPSSGKPLRPTPLRASHEGTRHRSDVAELTRRAGARWMRFSIRNQILIPIIGIQAVAVTAVTLATATLAANRSEREISARLNGVIDTLGHANFPYTASVLAKMRGLSGAHFAVFNDDGRVTDTTLPSLQTLPAAVRAIQPTERLDSLGGSPTFLLDGIRYFAVPLRASVGPPDSSLLILYPETSWRQARREAATPPLAVGLCTLGLMAAVTTWIAHRISARIRRLEQQVARIAAGDFERFDPGPRSDEVQELASSINRMCDQLRHMRQTIRQSERTGLLAQLAAGLAHQLRNSLTGARMSIQLHARRFPPRGGDESLNVALRQLTITEEQVKGLLSLGRIERQPHSECELGGLLAEITRLVNPSCEHARVDLRLHHADDPLYVMADPPGLRAAVLNLIMNAIEAAGPGGTVNLEALTDHGEVAIEVSDTGAGPTPEVAETLLEAFVTSKPEGVGLGLAIAQQVAAEHGGQLSWRREDGETRFRLALPRTNGTPKGAA
jgi:signal transduction histidine kinase